jgi:hypothetical protein
VQRRIVGHRERDFGRSAIAVVRAADLYDEGALSRPEHVSKARLDRALVSPDRIEVAVHRSRAIDDREQLGQRSVHASGCARERAVGTDQEAELAGLVRRRQLHDHLAARYAVLTVALGVIAPTAAGVPALHGISARGPRQPERAATKLLDDRAGLRGARHDGG